MHVGLRRSGDTEVRNGGGERPRRLLWCAAVLLAAVALFVCYLRLSRTIATNSDGASNALQAWDMLHGNLLLHGWYLSDVSFYTTELPEYMLVEAVRGLGSDVVHLSAALTYTLLVLLAAFVARGRARGREGLARGLLAGGIMLAPQLGNGVFALLSSPDHTGTAVPILVLLLLLDWLYDPAGPRWYLPVVTAVLLAWIQVGDSLATYAAAVPLAAVCALRAVASAARGRRLAGCAYDVTLAASAAASAGLARLVLDVLRAAGGFRLYPVPGPLLARPAAMPHQARVLAESVLALFGAQFSGQPSALRTGLAVVHLAGVALVAWAVLAALRGFFTRLDLVSQVLLAATLVTLAAGLLSTHVTKITDAHEVAVVLPFGAALAGRLLGARLLGARWLGAGWLGAGWLGAWRPGARPARDERAERAGLGAGAVVLASAQAALAVALAGYLAALAYGVSRPEPPGVQPVATWLAAHGLRSGLGGYWQAQSATLASGGVVTVAPLAAGPPSHGVYPYLWETKQSWYRPPETYANFLVSVPGPGQAQSGQLAAVRSFFGRPARTYHFGGYAILVWNRNLLTRLTGSQSRDGARRRAGSMPLAASGDSGQSFPFRLPPAKVSIF
ncbi:MAG: hypothetical protein JOY82_23595 [Streptosporangiaceae bacterium]|nr:hypothetical protein [Streptosporangiaceae bacterium]MBV9857468.1 hypothetical protein [Streptosporangiaceae bacterium]